MTVTGIAPVSPRMWRGFDDPSLPVGAYISLGLAVGDASGGFLEIEHQFKLAGQAGNGRFYNIEQMNAFSTDATFVSAFLVAVGFEELPTANITVQRWVFTLNLDAGGFAVGQFSTGLPNFPIFIGQSSPDISVLAAVRVGLANPGAGLVLQSVIQGYIWEPRSVMAAGGLQRPLTSLYG